MHANQKTHVIRAVLFNLLLHVKRGFTLDRNTPHLNSPNNSPPPVSVLCQIKPVHVSPSYLLKIHFNTILPSMPRTSKWSLSLRLTHQTPPYVQHASPIFLIWSTQYICTLNLFCDRLRYITNPLVKHIFRVPYPVSQTLDEHTALHPTFDLQSFRRTKSPAAPPERTCSADMTAAHITVYYPIKLEKLDKKNTSFLGRNT